MCIAFRWSPKALFLTEIPLLSTNGRLWCVRLPRFSRGPYGGVIKFDPTMRQRAFGKPRNEFTQMLSCLLKEQAQAVWFGFDTFGNLVSFGNYKKLVFKKTGKIFVPRCPP